MTIRNPVYVNAQQDMVDVEFNHKDFGWIPMTINQADYPDLWAEALRQGIRIDGELVQERQMLDALAERNSMSMSRPDFCIRLRRLGVIDQQWAVHAAQGNLPASLYNALVSGGSDLSMDDASIIWAGMTTINRGGSFVEAIRKHKNLTPIEMDDVFK